MSKDVQTMIQVKSDFREMLADAGTKFDGHVTHGSIEEQMRIIEWEFFGSLGCGHARRFWYDFGPATSTSGVVLPELWRCVMCELFERAKK